MLKLDVKKIPFGIEPKILESQLNKYLINKAHDRIEFAIEPSQEEENQKQTPILKEMDDPFLIKMKCYFYDNQCRIFQIEKIGNISSIKEYYQNFLKINTIRKENIKKESRKEEVTETRATISETYQLIETQNSIIEVYLTTLKFPEDVKNNPKIPLSDKMNIDVRIYSKNHNHGLSLDYFLKN
ncbi:MAG: hypothetical protein NZ853_05915 [Leptospiraceae bacterium]|nr:hypothetical protein [Leptospiraceae bacterium]MDW7976515.1 hypothetical protein [Leptospiraceae bacterium]